MIQIRPAAEQDFPAIWAIFQEIIQAGETYVNDETFTEQAAHGMWLGPTVQTFVAVSEERVVGAYKIVPNLPGRGSHVANGSYIVDADYRGHGIGRLMLEHSLAEAKHAGYKAIQFNFVVSTNEWAVKLYQHYGFQILATLPRAFRHSSLGYVDAYLMHRSLEETT
ncbi:MAG TPA: GNAT family N-acetyltransferase [Herpetosiphonaceae bacterium]